MMQNYRLGLLFVLSVPILASVGAAPNWTILGFNFTGWLWMSGFAAAALILVAELAVNGSFAFSFPWKPWLIWTGCCWFSLLWCGGLGARNVQDAVQISMPLLVGVLASAFVTSETELRLFLRVVRWSLLPLCLIVAATALGLLGSAEEGGSRMAALTAVLIGCVFLAHSAGKPFAALLGWAVCLALTVLTGSRMATAALLVMPIFSPLCRGLLRKAAVAALLAALARALFYLPVFQERFFYARSGTLEELFQGEFLTFGVQEAKWSM